MKRFLITLLLTLAGLTIGCSTRPSLTVNSLDHQKVFGKTFTQAYATRGADGDVDIVLLDNPIDDLKPAPAGKPLQRQEVRPLRHLVHIHVMWAPMIGAKGDNPSATNAAINWYVWGDAVGQQEDMIHYAGTAFVKVYAGRDDADFVISNALVKLKDSRGSMTDPVGTASVEGKFTAPINDARVKQLLAQLDAEMGGQRITRLDNAYPPSRTVEP